MTYQTTRRLVSLIIFHVHYSFIWFRTTRRWGQTWHSLHFRVSTPPHHESNISIHICNTRRRYNKTEKRNNTERSSNPKLRKAQKPNAQGWFSFNPNMAHWTPSLASFSHSSSSFFFFWSDPDPFQIRIDPIRSRLGRTTTLQWQVQPLLCSYSTSKAASSFGATTVAMSPPSKPNASSPSSSRKRFGSLFFIIIFALSSDSTQHESHLNYLCFV